MMFKKKSKDAIEGETSEKKGKKKKEKKPKLTPQEKAIKNKEKVEKQASAKVKKAETKVKKAETKEKNKEKAAAKKIKDLEKKAANKVKAEEKKIVNKQKKKEQKSVNKIKKQEKKAKLKSEKIQKKAELAARSPLQKKADRNLKMKKFLAVVILVFVLAGLSFAGIKFGPKLIEKVDLPEINISKFIDNIKSKIPFLNKEDSEEDQEELQLEENAETPESDDVKDDITLYISGNSVLKDFYSEALNQFLDLSKKELKDQCSIANTNEAYTNLINGDQQVIFSTFPTDRETNMAELAGVDLQPIPILNGGFVFFVNKDNPIKSLTVTQLYNIYSGTITNWKELGGEDGPILAYQRSDDSGSQDGIYKFVIDSSEILKVPDEMKILETNDIVEEVSINEGSIGYSYYYYLEKLKNSDDVKMIAVNSVIPKKDTIETEEYPLITHSYAIITTEEKTKSLNDIISSVDDNIDALRTSDLNEIKEMTDGEVYKEPLPLKLQFIEWILSDEGQKLAEEEGFIRHNN